MRLTQHVLTAAVCLVAAPVAAQTAGSCQPVFDAAAKQITTPNHVTVTITDGARTTTAESITAGGTMYMKMTDNWMKSPMSLEDLAKTLHDNENATGTTCQRLADETLNGTVAVVYQTHKVSPGSVADGKVWIAKATGLPLESEDDVVRGTSKSHLSSHYDYANIQAPVIK